MLKSTKLSNPHSFFPSYYALARCIINSSRVQPGVALKRYSLRPHLPCYHFHHSGRHGSSANHPLLSADALPSPTTSIHRMDQLGKEAPNDYTPIHHIPHNFGTKFCQTGDNITAHTNFLLSCNIGHYGKGNRSRLTLLQRCSAHTMTCRI